MLWSIAIVHLNIRESEFWRLTPAKWYLLWECWDDNEERLDFRSAQLAAILLNKDRPKGKKAVQPKELMPDRSKYRNRPQKQKPRQSVAEQIAIAREITLAFGGKVIDKKK